MRALLRRTARDLPAAHSLAGLLLTASQPAIATVFSGQWGFLLVASLGGTIALLHSGRATLAGLTAIPLLAKPQLFPFAMLGLVAWALHRRQGRAAVLAFSGAVLLVAASAMALPGSYAAWYSAVPAWRVADPSATTLLTLAVDVAGPLGPTLAVLVLIAMLVAAARYGPHDDAWLPVWLTLSILAAVYAHSYDYMVLVVPFVLATGALALRLRRRATQLALVMAAWLLVGSLFLYGLSGIRGRETLDAVLPLGLLVLIVVALPPRRSAPSPTADR